MANNDTRCNAENAIVKRLQNAASTAVKNFTFRNDEIAYINLSYSRMRAEYKANAADGEIYFKHNNIESKMKFEGDSIADVLQQMANYCKQIED